MGHGSCSSSTRGWRIGPTRSFLPFSNRQTPDQASTNIVQLTSQIFHHTGDHAVWLTLPRADEASCFSPLSEWSNPRCVTSPFIYIRSLPFFHSSPQGGRKMGGLRARLAYAPVRFAFAWTMRHGSCHPARLSLNGAIGRPFMRHGRADGMDPPQLVGHNPPPPTAIAHRPPTTSRRPPLPFPLPSSLLPAPTFNLSRLRH
jgi:hypothetical protein